METLVPGRVSRAGLLLLPLLLCFGPETAGSINPTALKKIVDHVDKYGFRGQYTFAVSLNKIYCDNAGDLIQVLPTKKLQEMQKAIKQEGGLYDPGQGNIVAARLKELSENQSEHAEWRLLTGGQNSPVSKLLARTYGDESCLIFFSFLSPCMETCLAEGGRYSILPMVSKTFRRIDDSKKAFVFRHIFNHDWPKNKNSLLQAWHRLPVPLYRCDNNGCSNCCENDPNTHPCLQSM